MEQSVSVLGLEARVYFQLWVVQCVASPIQSSPGDRQVNKWKSSGNMRFLCSKRCKKENVFGGGVGYGATMNGEVEKLEVRGEARGGGWW